ncbi:MAG: response regulator [Candidatus Marinimicrobia bacterium]|nr:response regulator [Candidatus Neomarinimicrobiota bacterium]MBL7023478.1 response regulator [Candidatus Neomarinimicrobiota bacterium]MBL7109267.1 response regulator [Candidatus Neomarinimicrobiota bacterium]
MDKRGKILWVDDEIDLLKPHILFLEKKGYNVTPVNSGEDALHQIKQHQFDLILLDEMMDGLDGLTTLKMIKEEHSSLPVIMITKNEEEWLMDEAIGAHISNYLTKPVNPSQILLACKNVLETEQIHSERAYKDYLQEFQKIGSDVMIADDIEDWYKINNKLIDWSITFDKFGEQGLKQILEDQYLESNRSFTQFISSNYKNWMNSDDKPIFSPDIVKNTVKPILEDNNKVVLFVIDCLRMDQWKAMTELLFPYYTVETDQYLSILPTATPYSRNAIFSGLYPYEIKKKYGQFWNEMSRDETSMNRFEETFLKDQMKRLKLSDKSVNYFKVITYNDGKKLENRISDYKNTDLMAIVINFVDMLGHTRSESDVLKEMVPDESGYRKAVCSWFENAWLLNVMKEISSWGHTVIITSDHGTTRVNKPINVKADRQASTGVRYKHGRNLTVSGKTSLFIKNPTEFRLPKDDLTTNFVIAKDDNFFVYPNDYHRFVKRFQNSFQHGGISMEEMIVPVAILKGKRK